MEQIIGVWENEGGATRSLPAVLEKPMIGTPNEVEWAVQLKTRVNSEFDPVAKALESAATKRPDQDRPDIQIAVLILEDKRSEVMARVEAGYFIHDWQELGDQVRRTITQDPRYKTIKARRIMQER